MGLAVSFNECLKRDTRCIANNISRKFLKEEAILLNSQSLS